MSNANLSLFHRSCLLIAAVRRHSSPRLYAVVTLVLMPLFLLTTLAAYSLYQLRPYAERVNEQIVVTERHGRIRVVTTAERTWRCPPISQWGLTLGTPYPIHGCGPDGGVSIKEWQFGPLEISEEHGQWNLPVNAVTPRQVVGHWYMGSMSMSGSCNLVLCADGTMSVQIGDCDGHRVVVKARWYMLRDNISYPSAEVSKLLGTYLSVVRVGKNIVLVPEKTEAIVKEEHYHYRACFWKNLRSDGGFELPKEAKEIERRRQEEYKQVLK